MVARPDEPHPRSVPARSPLETEQFYCSVRRMGLTIPITCTQRSLTKLEKLRDQTLALFAEKSSQQACCIQQAAGLVSELFYIKRDFDAFVPAFGIGFCILFVFIGTFTYVNFVLVREPHSLAPMTLGLIPFCCVRSPGKANA